MSQFRVASVPYVNAYPLVRDLLFDAGIEVVFAVPSQLPRMLESGDVAAILVSSVDALRVPGRKMAWTSCVGSYGPVESVRLFSKVPIDQIKTLALDSASMTSSTLVQIILHDQYGIRPICESYAPDQHRMLAACDACVLIGDIGMMAPSDDLHVIDLGDAWTKMTRLPFVWAAWIGGEELTPELCAYLSAPIAFRTSLPGPSTETFRAMQGMAASPVFWSDEDHSAEREEIYREVETKWGWPRDLTAHYLSQVMHYELSDLMLSGFKEFQRRLLGNGFSECIHFPELVDPAFEG